MCLKILRGLVLPLVLLGSNIILAGEAREPADKPAEKPGDGKWLKRYWRPAHTGNIKRAKDMAGKEVDILLVGDSITQAFTRGKNSKAFWGAFKGRVVINQGVKGDTTQNTLWGISKGSVDGLKPKVTVLMIGTNNTTGRYPPEEIAAGIKAILGEIKARLPETKVLLLGVFPRAQRGHKKFLDTNKAVNAIIKDYADDKTVFYQDLSPLFMAGENEIKTDLYTRDQLHLSYAGYEVWAKGMKPTVDKLLEQK